MEPALWKSVFYRPIEEFRRRIKAAAVAGEKGRAPLQKVGALHATPVTLNYEAGFSNQYLIKVYLATVSYTLAGEADVWQILARCCAVLQAACL